MEDDEHGGDGDPSVDAVDPTGDGEHGALTEGEEEASEGMPQLNPEYFDNLIFWLVVALASIFVILTRAAMPRLAAILATREGTVANDLAAAERLRAEAREAQAAYDKALADARAEAGRIAAAARAEVQAKLDADLAEADARIDEKAREGAEAVAAIERDAVANVGLVARDVAREVVAALGGRADDAAVDAAVQRRIGG